jgi:UDP-GlcNAc:undecaprenyl-phosphate GlcNAc-1-phosphate transferase
MNIHIMQWFDNRALIFMGLSLALNALVAYAWHKKLYRKFNLKSYQAIQRIHLNEIPRLGGFTFILSLLGYVIYSEPTENVLTLKLILLSLIPIIIFGLKEDFFHNVDPEIRLLSLFFVAWIFRANFTGPLPNLSEIPFIAKLILVPGGVGAFYILSITSIANGMNLIDGVNGLCGAVALSILIALLFLSYKTGDTVMLSLISNLIIIFIPFMVINYPKGLIFLGDLGAYSLGLITSMITIILFGRHPELSPWGAVLILIFPVIEVLFSVFRRIASGVSISSPDRNHLHLKLFNFFKSQLRSNRIANAMVTPVLSIFWLFPIITISWSYHKPFIIWICIATFIFLYGVAYMLLDSLQNKSKKM